MISPRAPELVRLPGVLPYQLVDGVRISSWKVIDELLQVARKINDGR
ncbi:MAG: hypothetical protein KY444_01760 [Gemmatimonadetes bacterium]|nr:hypothetical protein [Gemmatimonadota bacterium]